MGEEVKIGVTQNNGQLVSVWLLSLNDKNRINVKANKEIQKSLKS